MSTQYFSTSIHVIDSGTQSAHVHMDTDRMLLNELVSTDRPILHIYEWRKKSITYGHFIRPWDIIKEDKVTHFDLARRPTGGGLIFHYSDFSFSFLIPVEHPKISSKTIENYHLVNNSVVHALEKVAHCGYNHYELLAEEKMLTHDSRLCMAKPTKYDIMLEGLKIGGASQRRTKSGLLHQSSVFLTTPLWEEIHSTLINPQSMYDMMQTSTALFKSYNDQKKLLDIRNEIIIHLIKSLEEALQ